MEGTSMEKVIRDNIKESRLESLFTKDLLHLKEINFEGYEANLHNWELVIKQLFTNEVFENYTCLNTNELNSVSLLHQGKVLKLSDKRNIMNVVLNEMINNSPDRQLVPLPKYESTSLSQSAMSKFLQTVISKTIYDLNRYDVSVKNGLVQNNLNIISIPHLKKLSMEIYDYYKYEFLALEEYSDYIINKDHFNKLLQSSGNFKKLTELDLKLCLIYLSRDLKKLVVKDSTIKFCHAEEDSQSIDANDESIALLKHTLFKLNNVITKLRISSKDLQSKAIESINTDKNYAKNCLFNSKKIEKNLKLKLAQFENLNNLLIQINLQSFNKTLIEAITSNSAVLKELNNSTDLDQLQDAIDTMSDNIDESQKIGDLLASTPATKINDPDVDKELDELIGEVQKKQNDEKATQQIADDDAQDEELSKRFDALKSGSLAKTEFGVDDGSAPKKPAYAAKTEAGKTEAGKTEAGKTEAGKTEAGKTEAGKTEAGKTEAGKTEAGKTEAGKTEAGKTEAGKTEAGKTEAGKTETGITEEKDEKKQPLPAS